MEIVIKISKSVIEHLKDGSFGARIEDRAALVDAVMNGTPLPKAHDYIDRNNAITSICQHYTICERMKMLSFTPNLIKQEVTDILCAEPTIIEADKEYKNESNN